MSMLEGFKLADEVLLNAVKGISDIINIPGRVNVDFADVKTIMSEMGMALMGIGTATGPNRAAEAARSAINSPLLEDIDIEGATGILINITGTSSMTLHEISEASTLIQEAAHEEANIIFGAVIDETMGETIRVTVIATGFDQARVSFPDSAHGFTSIPQQGQFIPPNVTNQQQMPTQAFAGMNSQRAQTGFAQNIPAVNPYEVRSPGQPTTPQQHTQNQYNQPNQPSHYPRPQFGREMQPNFNNQNMNSQASHQSSKPNFTQDAPHAHPSNAGFRNSAPQSEIKNPNNQQSQIKPHENQMTSSWTNQQQNIHNSGNTKNDGGSDLEELTKWTFDMANQQHSAKSIDPKVIGASATKHDEQGHEDAAETALKLAKELSDIEIDDSDFETPAFMRRKDDSHRNA
jgi:cell division protein FtsZ